MWILLIPVFLKSFKFAIEISHGNYFSLFMLLEKNNMDWTIYKQYKFILLNSGDWEVNINQTLLSVIA